MHPQRRNIIVILLLIVIMAVGYGVSLLSTSVDDGTKGNLDSTINRTGTLSEPEAGSSSISSEIRPTRYKVKSGKIEYKYSGIQNGNEVVYFDDYGMQEIKFTTTMRENPFKAGMEDIALITLMSDTVIIVVDRNTNNAKEIDNSMLYELAEKSPNMDLALAAEVFLQEHGARNEGIDTILGLPATKWYMTSQEATEWRWRGLLLQTSRIVGRNYLKVAATELDTVTPLPTGIFDLPPEVSISEGMSMKEWIASLSKKLETRQVFDIKNQGKKAEEGSKKKP